MLERAQRAYAAVAQAICRFEPVTMISHPDAAETAKRLCGRGIDVLPLHIDESWCRDNGPTFLKNGSGGLAGTAWRFNAWGGKFKPYDDDALQGQRLLRHLGVPMYRSRLTLEGGAIHVDGEGTLLTTETALLNDNRNAGMSRAEVERELRDAVGVQKIIWLPGDHDEYITDGHIDGIACFVRPGVVLYETSPDVSDPHHEVLVENLKALDGITDAKGRTVELLPIEEAYEAEPTSEHFSRSYINFYIANDGIVMPGYGTPGDSRAKAVVARAFPDREIVQVDIRAIAPGGGGIHCITQQQPS
jgi:agmatine deiminase